MFSFDDQVPSSERTSRRVITDPCQSLIASYYGVTRKAYISTHQSIDGFHFGECQNEVNSLFISTEVSRVQMRIMMHIPGMGSNSE